MLDLDEYQKLAARTSNKEHNKLYRLVQSSMGLSGEAGEVLDTIKKVFFHGHNLSVEKTKIAEELGDVLWYVAETASALELSLNEIAIQNIEKLRKRYPEGFSSEKSINREV